MKTSSKWALSLYVLCGSALSGQAFAINCDTLDEWSSAIDGKQVNLHHVFCGEPSKNDRAKGFHAFPKGVKPSNFQSAQPTDAPNAAGVFTLRQIKLEFNGKVYTKSFSSMFPEHCSADQITASIVYSNTTSTGNCSNPSWAQCGMSAPASGATDGYCNGDDGKPFQVASALLYDDNSKINTGFPIYQP